MKSSAIFGLAAAAFALATVAGLVPGASAAEDPGCGEWRIALDPRTVVYRVPRTFLRAGSDSVWLGDLAFERGRDYAFDALRGELRLLRPASSGDTLRVRACGLLDPPPLSVQLTPYRMARVPGAVPDSGADSAAAAPFASRPATARDPGVAPGGGAALTLTGNKTVAVDFGSQQDAFLRQSLDLAVSGTLAPGVELTGVLSDQSVPVTEAGATQSLETVDRVLVELRAPGGTAALGDVSLAWSDGEFSRIERRLQGVRAEWRLGAFQTSGAAATEQGEFRRMQFFGVEGQQGPYLLTDRDGRTAVPVVAGSEVVTLDGARMNRGESADYAVDYERGRITFTNRRPISSESRITVDYQVAAAPYRRNLAAVGSRWQRGAWRAFTQVLREADDRGRTLEIALDPADRLQLARAGDSTSRALGPGVAAGGGDYDSVRVSGGLIYAFAGPDSGDFAVQFASAAFGSGDYAESTLVGGRRAFRWVGDGQGAFRIGRALPLPQSHELVTVGASFAQGGVTLDVEGAATRLDRNTFSGLDDDDNAGAAGRLALRAERGLGGWIGGDAGVFVEARGVERRFAPFAPLEQPFAEERWGLPLGGDLEHQRRVEAGVWLKPRIGGELRAVAGRLRTESGYDAWRRELIWSREGYVVTRASWERADGTQEGARFGDGGRERARSEIGVRGRWIAPTLRAGWDERRAPSDTGFAGTRVREGTLELASGSALAWRASTAFSLRRDARLSGVAFEDVAEVRVWRGALDSPSGRAVQATLHYQRRELDPVGQGAVESRSDLGGLRVRAEHKSGARADAGVEITAEGENARVRNLVFVGGGRGAYDALGNFVGIGDYELVVSILPTLERTARAATSVTVSAPFGGSEAWRGSRAEFVFESDARRRGAMLVGDPLISPRALEEDGSLARGSVVQRLLFDLAPASPVGAVLARVERRVTADRSFANFAQLVDDRTASARWRVRGARGLGAELEARGRLQSADQVLAGAPAFRREIEERGGSLQGVYTPGSRLRAAMAIEATWSRPAGRPELTRTLRFGPDLGVAVGARGRAEATLRRVLHAGPPPLDLLPTADPLATLRWEGTGRVDYRVHTTTTLGMSVTARDRADRRPQVTGRAELRAFF